VRMWHSVNLKYWQAAAVVYFKAICIRLEALRKTKESSVARDAPSRSGTGLPYRCCNSPDR
jgi:hypothetical protein